MNTTTESRDQVASTSIDPARSKVVREFSLPRTPCFCRYLKSGTSLLIGSEENEIRQWKEETNEVSSLVGHRSWVRAFANLPAEDQFVSAGSDGQLIWWTQQSNSYQVAKTIPAHTGWVRSIATSSNGKLLASSGNDRMVRIWSTADFQLIAELAGHVQPVTSVAFHPAGDRVVSVDMGGTLKDWDVSTGRLIRDIDGSGTVFENKNNRGTSGGLREMLFTPDGQLLIGAGVVGGGDPLGQAVNPGAVVFDWKTGRINTLLQARGNESGVCWAMAYHPTEHFVTAVSGGLSAKHVYFWKQHDEKPFHTIELPGPGRSLALHPDGKQLAVALHDHKVQIYSMS